MTKVSSEDQSSTLGRELEREMHAHLGPMLKIVLRASALVIVFTGVMGLFAERPPVWPVYGGFAAFLAVAMWLHRRGRTHAAGIVLSFGFWLTSSAAVILLGGIRSPGSFVLLPVVLTAALFWNVRAAVGLAIASIALEFLVAWLEIDQLLPLPSRAQDPGAFWRVLAGSLVMTAVLAVVALRVLGSAIRVIVHNRADREFEEKRLEDLERRLETARRLEGLAQLTGGVAHDFNNLLLVVLSASESLKEDLPQGSDEQERATDIFEAATRGSALARQLLLLGKRQKLEGERLDLSAVTGNLRPLLARLLGDRIDFTLSGETEPCPVWADRSQVEQVVLNLVVNARDAMPDGGKLTLEIGRQRESDAASKSDGREFAVLSVSDTGGGMDAETKAHIFEPFFTTKGSSGTGLGLAVVDRIVRSWGGRIRVESKPGSGARFDVFLPPAPSPN